MISAFVKSIRLPNLKTLTIDVRLGDDEQPYEHKKIDCPSLVSLSYRPSLGAGPFDRSFAWNIPMLRKLKLNCCQKFIKSLKHLEMLIVMNFDRKDKKLLGKLPALKFLYVQAIEDGKSFGSLEDEFGERVQIYFRSLPLRYARDKIRSLVPSLLWKAGQYGWDFHEKKLELYRGHFEHVSEEVHFYEFLSSAITAGHWREASSRSSWT